MEPVEIEESDSSLDPNSALSSSSINETQEVESDLDPHCVFLTLGMERMTDHSAESQLIQQSLLLRLGRLAEQTTIVAVHHNLASSEIGKFRLQCFERFREAVAKKNGGDANCSLAWYGASRKEICQILAYGFTGSAARSRGGSAISLSPMDVPLSEVLCAEVDEDGLSHVLLCQVILGKTEVVADGSEQILPSSLVFDCGVNCSEQPTKYIVWSSIMNTHVYPSYVVSFKAPYLGMAEKDSKFVSFNALLPVLSSLLHPTRTAEISRCLNEFEERKLSRPEMIKSLRQAAGDRLLKASLKFCKSNQGRRISLHFIGFGMTTFVFSALACIKRVSPFVSNSRAFGSICVVITL